MERASELAAGLAAELGVASAHEYSDAFMRACTATWDAASSWVYLAWLVVLPASRAVRGVTTSVWPHVREGVRLCWATFVAQGRTAIAAELSAVVLVILAILLKRHIARQKYVPRARAAYSRLAARVDARYTRFLDGLRKQSQTLAALFPHVAYAALVGIALRFLPSLAHSAAELTWALRVGLPLLASTHALANANRKAEVHWLQYWVVFASATLARALARAIPGGASLLALVPHGAELELAGYGWLHLPGTRSVEIAYGQLRPLYGATAPLRDRAATGWAPIGRTLAFATELLPARARTLSRAAADSGVLALALLFLPMPARLTHGGCLLFGLGYPAYASAAALWELEAQAERARERARRPVATPPPASGVGAVASALLRSADKLRRRTTGGTAGTDPSAGGAAPSGSADSDNASAAIAARTALSARLQYWTVRVALASALSPLAPVLAWVPLVTHAELLGLVWLQMPYFGGCALAPARRCAVRARCERARASALTRARSRRACRRRHCLPQRGSSAPHHRAPAQCSGRQRSELDERGGAHTARPATGRRGRQCRRSAAHAYGEARAHEWRRHAGPCTEQRDRSRQHHARRAQCGHCWRGSRPPSTRQQRAPSCDAARGRGW